MGSMGVRTVLKRLSATTPMILMFTIPVPGSKELALDDLADRILWALEAELSRRVGVQNHVDAALGERNFLILVQGEIERHVVGRAVRIEPASGEELQAHGSK